MKNDSTENQRIKMSVEDPTALMGTQVALNIAQGAIDAMNEAGISKSQLKDWNQNEIRKKSKEITKRFLGFITHDTWFEEKRRITDFYLNCFGIEWIPDFSKVKFPEIKGKIKRPEFIFPKMTEQEALNAYACYFGKDEVYQSWGDVSMAINRKKIQKRPNQNYVMFHVGEIKPDLTNYSYYDGIEKNIIFMTPLEGIISAFRHRFETGKMYDGMGATTLSALSRDGSVIIMSKSFSGKFNISSNNPNGRHSSRGLRQVIL